MWWAAWSRHAKHSTTNKKRSWLGRPKNYHHSSNGEATLDASPVSTQCHDLVSSRQVSKTKRVCTGHCAKKNSGQCASRTQSFARPATQFLHRLRNGMCVCGSRTLDFQPPWVDVTPRGLSARLLHLHLLQGDTTDDSLHRNPWSVSISLTKRSFCKSFGAPQPCVSLSALSTETRRHLPPEHSRSLHPRPQKVDAVLHARTRTCTTCDILNVTSVCLEHHSLFHDRT